MIKLCHARGGHTSTSANLLSSQRFAWTNVCFQTLVGWAVALVLCNVALAATAGSPALRKQQARTQFETAERMREALTGRPQSERTRREYQKVADAYRKVYHVSPASSKADASVVAVAEILAEMGRQFSPGEKDLHAAIGQYEFLRREYPGSKYRIEALFTIGQIYKDDLGDEASAKATFDDFVKRYPHSQLAPKAQEALAELNPPKLKKKTEVASRDTPAQPTEADATAAKKALSPRVTGVRFWSTEGYTRVAIDLDSEVKYESGRAADPDRIFFDLPDTRLVSTLVGKSFDVQDGFLKRIRVSQYQRGSTRVVLEVDSVTEYSAFLLPNPYRLIIDIHGKDTPASTQVASNADVGELGTKPTATTAPFATTDAKTAAKPMAKSGDKTDLAAVNPEQKAATMTAAKGQPSDPVSNKTTTAGETSTTTAAFKNPNGDLIPPAKSTPKPPPTMARATKPEINTDDADMTATRASASKTMSAPTSAPTAVTVTPDKKKSTSKKTAKTVDSDAPAAHEAAPTAAGDRSLIRALGLKIGRIVIDAGHGGHDTGTIGPNGLQEKDLVLDVALRLGKLLESRLGAEVIYTRDDDTFIPLETRTAIANEHQADLFISVHANSSRDESARGVETYYLNFTSNADALEVAARENAVSEKSIYELQDLVKKITLRDKIDESRELANDVQQSLYAGLSPKSPTLRNRGVKKAPFVVLIGANMPSILAEISFVSNPTDETKLQTPEYRQKIAESLYKGIAKYVNGLSGVKVASKFNKDAGQ
jgi:N-acetylmuramoyl-L-alanine amidase